MTSKPSPVRSGAAGVSRSRMIANRILLVGIVPMLTLEPWFSKLCPEAAIRLMGK
jgi:hypothetical protein